MDTSGPLGSARRHPTAEQRARGDQQKSHQTGIFRAIKEGRKEEMIRLIEKDPSLLISYDPVGANPIHVAFLYRRKHIGQMLVLEYPELATSVYGEGEYCGENILHIAIIHQDASLVRWLLQQEPELLNAEATGHFFAPKGEVYFGGYPLLFAVSSNQVEILRDILATRNTERGRVRGALKNAITLTDMYGNSALHMAVIHNLPEMYDVVAEEMRRHGMTPAAIRNKLNGEKLTPLALAAALGHKRMFQHILDKNSFIAWDYGPVSCKLFPLRGMEQPIVDPKTGEVFQTAIACMCAGAQNAVTDCLQLQNNRVPTSVEEGRLDLVVSPEVKQILDKKWNMFGQPIFLKRLAMALLTMLAWMVSLVIPNHYLLHPDNAEAFPTHNTVIGLLEWLVLLSIAWRAISLVWWLFARSAGQVTTGASAVEVALGNAFCCLYVCGLIAQRFEAIDLEDVAFSCAALMGWLHIFFFLLGFRVTGPFIIMVKDMVKLDLNCFFFVYMAILLGYTMALYLISDADHIHGPLKFLHCMQQMFLLGLVGDFSFDDYAAEYQGTKFALISALVTSYVFLVAVLLLNLLVAMMSNTYASMQAKAEKRWYMERANLMASYESERSAEEMLQARAEYATPFDQYDRYATSNMEFCLTTILRSEEWKYKHKGPSSMSPVLSPHPPSSPSGPSSPMSPASLSGLPIR